MLDGLSQARPLVNPFAFELFCGYLLTPPASDVTDEVSLEDTSCPR